MKSNMEIHRMKKKLKVLLKQDRKFIEDDYAALNPSGCTAIKLAMMSTDNPVAACEEMHRCIKDLNVAIREKTASSGLDRTSHFLLGTIFFCNLVFSSKNRVFVSGIKRTEYVNVAFPFTCIVPTLYTGESWELLQRRWGKLEKDFRIRDSAEFDITKLPDIYDCIRYGFLNRL